MNILWSSVAPWLPTGYGQQSAIFGTRIRDLGHDVAYAAYVGLEGTIGAFEGMTVYPADLSRFNKRMLREYVKREGDDVQVITLTDVWTWTEGRYGGIADWKGLKLAAWTPVDHDPCPPRVADALMQYGARAIAMSKFGQDRLRRMGLDPLYVPHGIDTNLFRPWDDIPGCREAMGLPKDSFVIGVVANNSGPLLHRKALPEILMAFSIFLQDHDDAFLYLHTDKFGENMGMNVVNMCSRFGIPEKNVGFVNQSAYWLNEIVPEHMACLYSCMDVLANPSLGEGFGVPIIEAQACGTPVIVNDFTSMPELLGAGWLVDGDEFWHDDQDSFWKIPAISEIVRAFEEAYEARGDAELSAKAREFALQYDADRVTQDYWVPALEALSKPREVPPLQPMNRAQRRALKAAA